MKHNLWYEQNIYMEHWLKFNKKMNDKFYFSSVQILCLAMQCLHMGKILKVVIIIIIVIII